MPIANFRTVASFAHARDAIESALTVDEVVAALGAYADEAGELALQVFPRELRSSDGVASLAVELTRLGMRSGFEEDREWRALETLFARAAVRISELMHPSATTHLNHYVRDGGTVRNRHPARPG